MASLGVLKPKPMLFQNRFPPFPGLFPFEVFFALKLIKNTRPKKNPKKKTVKKQHEEDEKESSGSSNHLKNTFGCLRNAFSVCKNR